VKYVSVPDELHITEISAGEVCFAPGRYVRFIPPRGSSRSNFVSLDKLVVLRDSHITVSKDRAYRYAEIGDVDVDTGGIAFRSMPGYQLPTKRPSLAKHGDVLVSTVRTYRKGIGYVTDLGNDLITTNAFLNVCGVTKFAPDLTLLYVYSFLRTDFFVEQVWSMLNRGLYPRMDKGALDKILIPVPIDKRLIRYVSSLMQAVVDKEQAIREGSKRIDLSIEKELLGGQRKHKPYTYAFPTLSEVNELGRLDASMYSEDFRKKAFLLKNYEHGSENYDDMGFDIGRGQNLQVSCIGKSIYSEVPKHGFYRLAAPTDLSEFRTIRAYRYLGSSKELAQVRKGDVIFGAEGFCKGRVVIIADEVARTITNIHGVVFHPRDGSMLKGIFLGCFLGYLRSIGLVDAIGAGGSGGSLAIGYFNHVPIPKFPAPKQEEIARLYHHEGLPPSEEPTLDTFVDWHRTWNASLGIWELDREMKSLQRTLAEFQEHIIAGRSVVVPLA
jgi:hypothetical protein